MCDFANREQAMVTVRPGVTCDPCLVPLVRALYQGGFPTIASCCGHGKRPASVLLADGRTVFVMDERWQAVFDRAADDLRCRKCDGSGSVPQLGRKSTNSKGHLAYFECDQCGGDGYLFEEATDG